MGVFRDPITINNVGAVGSTTNPLTGSALGMDRENQKAIKELIGTLDWESLSILDGGITPVSSEIIVDTEDGTPADDLTTINLTSDGTTTLHTGMRIKIKSADPSRVITVKHLTGGGNIRTADGQGVVLSNDWTLDLKLQNGVWVEQKGRGYKTAVDASVWASTALARTAPATTTSRGIGRVATAADEGAIANGPAFLAAGTDGAFKQAARAKHMATGNFDLLTPGTYICDNIAGGITNAPPNFSKVFVYTKTWVPAGGSIILYDEARSFEGPVRVAHRSFVPTRGTWSAWTEFSAEKYEVGEFYFFRHPTIKPGFAPLQGGLISGVYQGKNITEYPIWAYLQTTEGQKLCTTEANWQAMTKAIWHTNADGSQVGWNGIGGAPFFAPHWGTGALRLPDLRGMYAEAAGFDYLGVGGVHGDGMRPIEGYIDLVRVKLNHEFGAGGAFSGELSSNSGDSHTGSARTARFILNTRRTVPTSNQFQPRAYGVLACVYLGMPR